MNNFLRENVSLKEILSQWQRFFLYNFEILFYTDDDIQFYTRHHFLNKN